MEHLITERHPSFGWRVRWLIDKPTVQGSRVFTQEFSRMAMGISLDNGPHLVVVAERRLVWRQGSECYYWVVDEESHHMAAPLIEAAIAMKDKYQLNRVYAPNAPQHLTESLREADGLTHYQTDNEHTARRLWPTFHSFDTIAGIHYQTPAEEVEIHRSLEEHLTTTVPDQELREPVLDADGEPITRLSLPGDLNNRKTSSAIRQVSIGPCIALWLVMDNLFRSRDRRGRQHVGPESKKKDERQANPITGY